MKVEISMEEIEAMEQALSCAIKSNSMLQVAAIMSQDNNTITIKDCLEANLILNTCYQMVERIKGEVYEQKEKEQSKR